jgi:drug/metabolite transporter (DMT)-like permease
MQHRLKGTLIALAGVVVLSPDAMLVRLSGVDLWSMVFWRGLGQGSVMLLVLALLWRGGTGARIRSMGLPGVLAAFAFGSANVLFVVALYNTSVANTLVLISTTPTFAALLSVAVLRERLPLRTWAAVGGGIVAIAVIVGGDYEAGTIVGDLAAIGQAVMAAATFVLFRARPEANMVPSMAFSSLLAAAFALAVAPVTMPAASEAPFLALLCVVVLPLSFGLLTLAPRYIPAPEVTLIMLLEMVLGPLFAWAAVGEAVPVATALGGAILLGTLVVHSVLALRAEG